MDWTGCDDLFRRLILLLSFFPTTLLLPCLEFHVVYMLWVKKQRSCQGIIPE